MGNLMSNVSSRFFIGLSAIMFVVAAMIAPAHAAEADPKALVERVTSDLFSNVKGLKKGEISDAQYNERVKSTLDEVVNFPFIAANVMGKAAYSSATAVQRQAFASVFRDGLVNSYSKGISGYADSDIKVVSVVADPKNAKRVTVQQEVTDKGTVHKLDYTMVQGVSGEWKVINVTLNGVNLGMSFSSQFKSSMRKHGNDLDKVIAGWLSES